MRIINTFVFTGSSRLHLKNSLSLYRSPRRIFSCLFSFFDNVLIFWPFPSLISAGVRFLFGSDNISFKVIRQVSQNKIHQIYLEPFNAFKITVNRAMLTYHCLVKFCHYCIAKSFWCEILNLSCENTFGRKRYFEHTF